TTLFRSVYQRTESRQRGSGNNDGAQRKCSQRQQQLYSEHDHAAGRQQLQYLWKRDCRRQSYGHRGLERDLARRQWELYSEFDNATDQLEFQYQWQWNCRRHAFGRQHQRRWIGAEQCTWNVTLASGDRHYTAGAA